MAFGKVGSEAPHTEVVDSRSSRELPERLVLRRRLVEAAVALFVRNGYHETTTREIAQAAGWTVGELYEFVKSKGDILCHVCEVIQEEVELLLEPCGHNEGPPEEALRGSIDTYIRSCDQRQDVILLIYQESNCLTPELRRRVLESEEHITSNFRRLIEQGVRDGSFRPIDHREMRLMAHNIVVLGQMWAFRRWYLKNHFTLEEYIAAQFDSIIRALVP